MIQRDQLVYGAYIVHVNEPNPPKEGTVLKITNVGARVIHVAHVVVHGNGGVTMEPYGVSIPVQKALSGYRLATVEEAANYCDTKVVRARRSAENAARQCADIKRRIANLRDELAGAETDAEQTAEVYAAVLDDAKVFIKTKGLQQ